jgi:hypothetical protein
MEKNLNPMDNPPKRCSMLEVTGFLLKMNVP